MSDLKYDFDQQSRREFIAAMLLAAGVGAATASNLRAINCRQWSSDR